MNTLLVTPISEICEYVTVKKIYFWNYFLVYFEIAVVVEEKRNAEEKPNVIGCGARKT
jgi:hypothetical protein